MADVVVARMVNYNYPFTWRKYLYSHRIVMTQPKPCPFCNDDDVCVVTDGLEPPSAWVECTNCEANGPHVALPINISLYDSAIAAWNDR